jgi:hypothetical protein
LIIAWKVKNSAYFKQLCERAPIGHSEFSGEGTRSYIDYNRYSEAHPWISKWTGTIRISSGGIGLDKRADKCVCDFEFGLDLEATDTADFNLGERFGWHDIMHDDWFIWLRDHTILGGDYQMWATSYELINWRMRYGK